MVCRISSSPDGTDVSAMWQEMLKKSDEDGDGKINKTDFKAALPQGTDESTADETFDEMDTNHDGYVSAGEYAAAMQKLGLMTRSSQPEGLSTLA